MILGVLGGLYTILGEHALAAAVVYSAAELAHGGGNRATFEGQTRWLALTLARAGQNDGALLLDAWARLHDAPAAWGTPWEDTAVLDRLRDAQNAEQRGEHTAGATSLDEAGILAVARACIDALSPAKIDGLIGQPARSS